ncbi:hypothetical protein TNCV_1946111 [Trichonephila clavipes]|uniref:Uncharacterized protein n=1 Tax=Trichonephila clavipes TaxID=2585209 RepID=A0A8X6SD68_TRICX|nr:hypothetical protein TNCV_1946111 [Trichonephila clavipes]
MADCEVEGTIASPLASPREGNVPDGERRDEGTSELNRIRWDRKRGRRASAKQMLFNDIKCLAALLELIKSSCQSLKQVASLDGKMQAGQIGDSLVIWVEAMQPLEDAGKNRRTVTDFSVMMVEVDLGP